MYIQIANMYIANVLPYPGKDENRLSSLQLSYVVLKLMQPFICSGRTVATNNFFANKFLATQLIAKKTTLIESVHSNKRKLSIINKKKRIIYIKHFSLRLGWLSQPIIVLLQFIKYSPKHQKLTLL